MLDSLLRDVGRKQISQKQVLLILDALAGAQDPAIVARFPAALAICLHRGIELNSQELLGRYWESSPKRQNLEKLLLVSAGLFRKSGLVFPNVLQKIADILMAKHGDPMTAGALELSDGICVSITAMGRELGRYVTARQQTGSQRDSSVLEWSPDLQTCLDRLFSPKQKQLIYKRLTSAVMTKTEREYYSRVVKKKLQAIAHGDVQAIASRLAGKPGRSVELSARK